MFYSKGIFLETFSYVPGSPVLDRCTGLSTYSFVGRVTAKAFERLPKGVKTE